MSKKNAAIICVSKQSLLKFLDFEGGTIHRIQENPDYWKPDTIEIILEHPDLDEVEDNYVLRRITPLYLSEIHVVQVDEENEKAETFEKIERIEPAKRAILTVVQDKES